MPLNPSTMISEPVYHGDNREKLPVIGSSGVIPINGNYTMQAGVDWPDLPARELYLTNDSGNDIQIVANCTGGMISWLLHAGETINERLPPFTSVVVAASGLWRFYVRGNLT